MKTIGVVVATYNGETFLKEQIESIVSQTLPPREIIIVDDGSKDGTHEIIREYTSRAPEAVVFIKNQRNLGAKCAFEIGISHCSTDYIALSDQDDIWERNKLEVMYRVLEENNEALLCSHDLTLMDHGGEPIGRNFWEAAPLHEPLPVTGPAARRRLAQLSNPIPGCTMFFSSTLKKHILPIPSSKWVGHDWWISVNAFFLADPIVVEDTLTRYRLHPDQTAGIGTSLKKASYTKENHSLSFKINRETKRILKKCASPGNRNNEKDKRVMEMSAALLTMIEACEKSGNHRVRNSELQELKELVEERLKNLSR